MTAVRPMVHDSGCTGHRPPPRCRRHCDVVRSRSSDGIGHTGKQPALEGLGRNAHQHAREFVRTFRRNRVDRQYPPKSKPARESQKKFKGGSFLSGSPNGDWPNTSSSAPRPLDVLQTPSTSGPASTCCDGRRFRCRWHSAIAPTALSPFRLAPVRVAKCELSAEGPLISNRNISDGLRMADQVQSTIFNRSAI